jgi:hypothetical protein
MPRNLPTSLFIASLLLLVLTTVAGAQCVSGTSTASVETSGPYDGLWKYTVDISWTTTQGLSNVTMDCGFGICAAATCAETFSFETVAGTGSGDGCTVDFAGEFNCNGNPSIGINDPIVKWDVTAACEAENSGTATLYFYSSLGPSPQSQAPVFLLKNGQNVCTGQISGDCPTPPCVVPVSSSSWGGLKEDYQLQGD